MNVLSLFDGISCGQIALARAGIKVDNYYASEIDKNAIQVTQKNYPNTIQLGDVTQIKAGDLPKIDLLIGGSPCFVKGTKIIEQNSIKNIEDIKVGDYVLTHNKNYKKVLNTGNTHAETIIIKAQGIKPTETTKEHPYYVRKMSREKGKRVFSDPLWIPANDLKSGDFLGIPINNLNINKLNLTEEECYVLGRYIADGHTSKHYRISENRPNDRHWQLILSVGSHKVESFKSKILNMNFSCFPHSKSVHRIVFSNKRLVEIAEAYCGCGAKNKTIHKVFLDLPINLLKKLLDGYLDGDCCFKNGVYRSSSISEDLIITLSQAIAKVYNVNSSYEFTLRQKTCIIENRIVNQNNTYSISFRENMKKKSVATIIDGIIWVPFKQKIETNSIKIVYNLEVEDDNSYTANSVIVHNCQDLSSMGSRKGLDGEKSSLFFEYIRLLKECNPKYFLLENNFSMSKCNRDKITEIIGVNPILINSSDFSAQNRKRLYWTNIPIDKWEVKNIYLKDIINNNLEREDVTDKILKYVFSGNYKGRKIEKTTRNSIVNLNEKSRTIGTGAYNIGSNTGISIKIGDKYYKPNRNEFERLQTVPDNYTEILPIKKAVFALGNGWTVDVIAHILKGLK